MSAEATTQAALAAALSTEDIDIANLALDLLVEDPIANFTDTENPISKWMARNYAAARDAELRTYAWKFAITRRKLYPLEFVLAGITGTLTGAWGMLRLTEDYNGSLAILRRSSDSTTDDFTSADDSVLIDNAAVADFVGDGDGYIASFFDQSVNARPIVQATTTKQPLYEYVSDEARLPAAAFDGVDDLLSTAGALSTMISTSSGYIVLAGMINALSKDSALQTSNHLIIGDASSKFGLYARVGGALYGVNNDGAIDSTTDAIALLTPFVVEIRHADGVVYTRVNGEAEQQATSGNTSSLAGILNIGDLTAGGHALDFNMFAAMTFSTAPTANERDRLVERLMRAVGAGGREDFGWLHRYPMPADCLRMLQIRDNGAFEGDPVPHEIERGYILTDKAGPLYCRYIGRVTDATRFDPLFVESFSAKLAAKAAHFITGKATMVATVKAIYDERQEIAKDANALESTVERPFDTDVIAARYATGDVFISDNR